MGDLSEERVREGRLGVGISMRKSPSLGIEASPTKR